MGIARGELQVVSHRAESTFGTRDPGNFTLLPHNSEGLIPSRQWFESARCLGDRQVADGRLGRKSVSGDITSEMCYANLDRLLEMLLCRAKATVFTAISSNAVTATASDQSFNGTNLFTGVSANEWIYVSGFTSGNNNGLFKVATQAASKITVYGSKITDESPGDDIVIREVNIVNGTTEFFSTIHKAYYDGTGGAAIDEHDVLGAVVTQGALTVPANGIATMNWSFAGRDYDHAASSVTNDAQTDYAPFDGLSGTVAIDGAATAQMTSFSLTVANGHTPTEVLGTVLAGELIPRKFRVSGSFTIYHTGTTQIAALLNETEQALTVTLSDPDGNQHVWLIPRAKITSGGAPKQDDGPISESINFTALKDQDASEVTVGVVMIPAA